MTGTMKKVRMAQAMPSTEEMASATNSTAYRSRLFVTSAPKRSNCNRTSAIAA